MGTGWKIAFCNAAARDSGDAAAAAPSITVMDKQQSRSPKIAGICKPSTPRLRCKTAIIDDNNINSVSPKLQSRSSTPRSQANSPLTKTSSPRSPFSILKNTLRLSKNSCGICTQSVKRGQGMAIYTAECSHSFHFPCIASYVRNQNNLICPVCSTTWKNVPLLSIHKQNQNQEDEKIVVMDSSTTPSKQTPISSPRYTKLLELTTYADDEPLFTPKAGAKFVPIPEGKFDEEEEVHEFQGFFVNPISNSRDSRNVEVTLSPEAAVISTGRTHGTYAVVLKVKAPPPLPSGESARRGPVDLVTVLDVGGSMSGAKLEMLQRAMRLVISSLGSADRLSILAFSAVPRRLLPLTRMTTHGQRLARRIIDRLACSQGTCMAEALRQATKVLEDRRERNPVASIILLSDGQDDGVPANNESNQRLGSSHVSSTRFAHVELPVHSSGSDPAQDAFSKCVGGLLSIVIQDLKIQLGFASGSDPGEISAVYPFIGRSTVLDSACISLGNLYAEEERELLVEIRASALSLRSHHVFSIRSSYQDPATHDVVCGREQRLLVPRPQSVGSGSPTIERLRNGFITTRAIAESLRLIEHNEVCSAMQLLSSARALLLQSISESAGECIRSLEAELAEIKWRRQHQRHREMGLLLDENGEPLTPASAWRAAEKLAKLAQMKKSFNRGSDLHGFENARF